MKLSSLLSVVGAVGLAALGCAGSPASSSLGSGGAQGSGSGGSTGTGSGGRSAGTGGAAMPMPVTKDPSTYTQTAGAKFLYPQNHRFANCPAFPAYDTDVVMHAYTAWKTKFYSGGRVIRPDNGNDTVSEGIAYGMLASVYFNDQTVFDTLWGYAQSHMDGNGVMNWHWTSSGSMASDGQGGATDADEDMAWALLMAGAQWGNSKSYTQQGTTLIGNIWNHEVDHGGGEVLKPGDMFGGASQTNPSYFAPAYYRVFGAVTNNATGWNNVIAKSYQIIASSGGSHGLVPDWSDSGGGRQKDGLYHYDACRTPWRIALDYCMNGDTNAKAYLDKINAFFSPKRLDQIFDSYTVDGTQAGTSCNGAPCIGGMSFVGPLGVSAMSSTTYAPFAQTIYTSLAGGTNQAYVNSASFSYFHASWAALSLLTLSGNFFDYTQ